MLQNKMAGGAPASSPGPSVVSSTSQSAPISSSSGTHRRASTRTIAASGDTANRSENSVTVVTPRMTDDADDSESSFSDDSKDSSSSKFLKTLPLSEINRKIVTINIRHFQVLFWIFLFTNLSLCPCYIGILKQILKIDHALLFSIELLKPFLLPSLPISTLLTIIHVIISHSRANNFSSALTLSFYRTSCVVFLLHYLIMITVSGLQIHDFSTTELRAIMSDSLNGTKSLNAIPEMWEATHRERRCCGISGHEDWLRFPKGSDDDSFEPRSCCSDETKCIAVWKTGCFEREKGWIEWYVGWYLGVLILGFALFILLHIQMERIYQYCKIYRRHWIYPNEPRE